MNHPATTQQLTNKQIEFITRIFNQAKKVKRQAKRQRQKMRKRGIKPVQDLYK